MRIGKVCGFSAAQTTRLIRRHVETGAVEDRRGRNGGRPFGTVYTPAAVRLLAEADGACDGMSGLPTCVQSCGMLYRWPSTFTSKAPTKGHLRC